MRNTKTSPHSYTFQHAGWHAHAEAITKCSFFSFGSQWHIHSTAHDGFQQVWSLGGILEGQMRLPNVDAKMLEVHKNQSGDCQVDWNLKQVRAPKPSYVIYGTTTCTHCPFCTRTCEYIRTQMHIRASGPDWSEPVPH